MFRLRCTDVIINDDIKESRAFWFVFLVSLTLFTRTFILTELYYESSISVPSPVNEGVYYCPIRVLLWKCIALE